MSTKREYVTAKSTKVVSGMSSMLVLLTNIGHNAETLGIYEIPFKEIRKNGDLRLMLFGRESSNHALKMDKACNNYLLENYSHCLRVDFFMNRDRFSELKREKGIDGGSLFELLYIDLVNGKHGTEKEDKRLKIDVHKENKVRCQLKASIAYTNNHGSYSVTNGNCIERG